MSNREGKKKAKTKGGKRGGNYKFSLYTLNERKIHIIYLAFPSLSMFYFDNLISNKPEAKDVGGSDYQVYSR